MKKIFILLLIILPANLFAQEQPAILSVGPEIKSGIDIIDIEMLKAWYGEYQYQDLTIKLYYTNDDIKLPAGFKKTSITSYNLRQYNTESGLELIAYIDKKGWTVFVIFPKDCVFRDIFIEKYIKRQSYFNNISKDKESFSFPAILFIE